MTNFKLLQETVLQAVSALPMFYRHDYLPELQQRQPVASLSMMYVWHHSSYQHSHTEGDHLNLGYNEHAWKGIEQKE
jgi:hypothetical protein